ncbi:toxin Cry1Ac domain D-VI-related protein, partial [Listeria booriae]|uniref:toxin Cry1Ac domain D-VI-related protein n=1 Tax=Listeria booriae TaxID=1552123 RepID=UPI00162A1377
MKNTKIIQKTVKLTAVGAIVLSSMVQPLSIIATASEVTTKAETKLLTSTDASTDAATAVNNLFIDNDPTKNIKITTTQAMIDAAEAKVAETTDATIKAQLTINIKIANDLLELRSGAVYKGWELDDGKLIFKVDAEKQKKFNLVMYKNGGHIGTFHYGNTLVFEITTANGIMSAISNAGFVDGDKIKVNYVYNNRAYTIDEFTIDIAYSAANKAVKELFIDNDISKHIKGLTDQANVDAAKALVNAVTDATQKAKLLESIDKAQTEVDHLANFVVAGPIYTDATSFTGTRGEAYGQIVFKVYDSTGTWVKAQKVVGTSSSG